MARPRKSFSPFDGVVPPNLMIWAESLGEALGRGMARGFNAAVSVPVAANGAVNGARRRGRPPKVHTGGPVPAERRCEAEGCVREMRSKGLCSAHYQAERRKQLLKGS